MHTLNEITFLGICSKKFVCWNSCDLTIQRQSAHHWHVVGPPSSAALRAADTEPVARATVSAKHPPLSRWSMETGHFDPPYELVGVNSRGAPQCLLKIKSVFRRETVLENTTIPD